MRFNHTKLFHGLLLLASLLLAACGGGGGSSGTVTPVNPPAAPTVGTPVAGCNAINISWAAVSGATGYNVYGSGAPTVLVTTSNKLTATPVTAISYTDAGLALNTTRYYKVMAVNAGGESSGSSEVTSTTTSGCTNKGGSIQGNPLNLTTAVSTLAGTAGTAGAADGTGAAAKFTSPQGITTDGTYLYVADTTNNTIRQVALPGGAVSAFATGLNAPQGITFDGTNFYVANTAGHAISVIGTGGGVVSTFAGTGVAGYSDGTGTTLVQFNQPQGITTDGMNLYVADTTNHLIRKIVISSVVVTTVAGSGTAGSADGTGTSASFSFPSGITTDGTNLYDTDYGKNTIRKIQ